MVFEVITRATVIDRRYSWIRFVISTANFTALILIIEREIRVLLKHTNLAHALGTDAARGNVCHTTILETQPRICDVFTAAQDRHPHRIDALHRRTNEM